MIYDHASINYQVEFCRPLDRKLGGLSAFENLIDKEHGAAVQLDDIYGVADEAARLRKIRAADRR
jgi:hypothetical protein